MTLAEWDQEIEAFPPNRPDQPFTECVGLWCSSSKWTVPGECTPSGAVPALRTGRGPYPLDGTGQTCVLDASIKAQLLFNAPLTLARHRFAHRNILRRSFHPHLSASGSITARSATKSSGETLKPRNESTVATTVHGFHGHGRAGGFQWVMARCNSCSGIITKTDLACYVCGEPVREAGRGWFSLLRFWAKPTALSGKVRECQETRS